MELPRERKTIGCKWMFTIKCKADSSVERYKAKLVTKMLTQTLGIDYQETFCPNSQDRLNSCATLFGCEF